MARPLVKSDPIIPAAAPRAPRPTSRKKRRAARNATPHDMHDGHDADLHTEIHDDAFPTDWTPPGALEAPAARSGFNQRWIRFDLRGKTDAQNIANQVRQGWRPRVMDTIPKGDRKKYQFEKSARFGMCVTSGDLTLCEMPNHLFKQMQAFYAQRRKSQVGSVVDGFIADQNRGGAEHSDVIGPIEMTRRTKVTTRKPIVAADSDEKE